MAMESKYYLVQAEVLPEVFLRVAEANRMLRAGEVKTAGAAAKAVGISRSAYYKYKDAIRPFNDRQAGRIVTFSALLQNTPGVLSSVLGLFARSGANILTINQSIPIDGCAGVTISAETSTLQEPLEALLEQAAAIPGVVHFEVMAG